MSPGSEKGESDMIDSRALQTPAAGSVGRGGRIRLAIVAGAIVLATAAGLGTWQATAHGSSAPTGRTAVVQTNPQLRSFQQLKDEGYPDSSAAQRLTSFQQLKRGD
jgi:hypothetical protein